MRLNDFLKPFKDWHDETDSSRHDLIRLMKVLKPHYNIACHGDVSMVTLRCYPSELVTVFVIRDDEKRKFEWSLAWRTGDFLFAESHTGSSFLNVTEQAIMEIHSLIRMYGGNSSSAVIYEPLIVTMEEIGRIRETFALGKEK